MVKFYNRVFAILMVLATSLSVSVSWSQTVLINPTQEGGFELGPTFGANGWSESSSANNPWVVGTAVATAPIAGNSAYISLDGGVTTGYNNANPCVNYFWRDVTVPAGQSVIQLSFNWQQQGESSWDIWQVFVAPTSVTPVGQAAHPGSGTNNVPASIAGATYVGNGALIAGVQTANLTLPANLAGTTFRLIFAWKSDNSFGTQPPAAIDNISLTSRVPGTFISIVTGNWSAPSTWQANAVPTVMDTVLVSTGHIVTIDGTNQGAGELTINGTLTYGTVPTTFDVLGNMLINTGGVFNVFNGTTGKTVNARRNITVNGSMDISVGTTTAGNLTLSGTTVQTISGTGTFGASNVIRNITCANTNTSIPNIVWSINNVKIANNLNLTGARIDLGTNKMTFGNNAAPGTLTAPAGTGFIAGAKFSRFWSATATGSTITAGVLPTSTLGLYPFITSTGQNRSMFVRRTNTTGAVAGELSVVYNDASGVTSGLALNDGGYNITTRTNGNWVFSNEGTALATSSYILAAAGQGIIGMTGTATNARLVNPASLLSGTHQNGTNYVVAQRNTILQTDLLAAPVHIGIGSIDYVPATPGTLTQAPGLPTCTAGTSISATGSPETDVTWYWQTSATGTAITTPYTGPYVVFANGTYFLRGFNSVSNTWSANSSSITISNFPTATPPPAPTAAANPACTPGTTISVPAAPANNAYFWQGTVVNGSATTDPATVPYNVSTTGTYQVAAYDSISQCWSNTVGLLVTVDSQIPNAPSVTNPILNICTGATTGIITATTTSNNPGSLATTQAGGNGCTNGNMFNLTTGASPINVTSLNVTPNTNGAQTVAVYYKVGTYIGSETNIGAWTLVGNYPITGATGVPTNIDISDVLIPASSTYGVYVNFNAQYSNIAVGTTYTNPDLTLTVGAGLCTAFSGPIAGRAFNGTIFYTKPVNATATWFDAATGGNILGTGSPFETVGTTLLASPAASGNYTFYVASTLGGCYSPTRDSVVVAVAPVNVTLNPIDATCNALDDGSFSLGTVQCGSAPFEYSFDNGVTFSPLIPTNLTAGTYTIIVRDATMALSGPTLLTINEPGAPTALTATNVTYFNATLGWTAMGSETSWVVEYGPAGFTPGTGTVVTASTNPLNITGLTEDTDYEFYVAAGCAPGSAVAGPFAFSTDPGFFTYDNACGPGYTSINTTGTALNLTDDQQVVVNITNPLSVNGVTSTAITVSNNGFVQFGGVTLNVWNQDWDDEEGNVYWQETTIGGDNYFIVEWYQRPRFSGVIGQNVTFQLAFNQTTNEFYYLYLDKIVGGTQASSDNGGNFGLISVVSPAPIGTTTVSNNSTAYLTANSCAHFYNALCPNVTAFTSLIFQEDAIFDWNPGPYGETAWTLVYGTPGFDPTVPGQELGTYNLGTSDFSFSGAGVTLTQLTEYDVYIYSECAADNLTSPGFFFNFTTLPFCSNPATLSGNTDVDTINMAWNWIESSPDYPVESFNIQYGMSGFPLYTGTEIVAVGTNNADTIVDASLMGGGVYQVYVQAVCTDLLNGGTDTSAFIGPFTVVMPLTTDTVCGAELLQVDGTQYTFNNTGGTVSPGEATIAPPATGAQTTDGWINSTLNRTTWYKFVAPASGSVRVNATGVAYNGQIAVYDVANCADFLTNFDLLAANDNEIGGTSLAPNFTVCGLTPGNEYYIMHDGFDATAGNHSIILTEIVLEAGNANALSQICYGDTLNLFTTINGYDAGGAWSAPIAAANASITDSIFNSTGLAYQTFVFQYRVTDGCAYDSITSQVQIFAPSSAGTDGALTVCKNEPFDLLSGLGGNVDLGGTWYDPSNNALPSSMVDHASAFPGSFNYDYITGNGVCPDDTANVVVTVSASCDYFGIEEAVFADVQVYPNPSTGVIFVETTISTGAFDYSVTDANGRVVAQANNGIKAAATSTIDLTGVERGIYFVKLSNASADKVYRIVIQ